MSKLAARNVKEVRERSYTGIDTRKVALSLQLSKFTRAQLSSR